MTSDVRIANMALGMLGAKAQVASLNPPDGSYEAGLCATFLQSARGLVIENGTFPFTYKRERLAPLELNNSDVWQFAYSLPSDCLIPMRIVGHGITSKAALFMSENGYQTNFDSLMNETASADFYQEGGVIYSNQQTAMLLYKRDVTDTRYYTPGFEAAVAMALAGFIAGPIIGGGDGMSIGAKWSERASAEAKRASANAANASKSTINHVAPWMAQR